jgi:hypothetical protein
VRSVLQCGAYYATIPIQRVAFLLCLLVSHLLFDALIFLKKKEIKRIFRTGPLYIAKRFHLRKQYSTKRGGVMKITKEVFNELSR